jgi:hypothetical protein
MRHSDSEYVVLVNQEGTCVGSIIFGMILSHNLSLCRLLVSLTDLSLAAFQIWWLASKRFQTHDKGNA